MATRYVAVGTIKDTYRFREICIFGELKTVFICFKTNYVNPNLVQLLTLASHYFRPVTSALVEMFLTLNGGWIAGHFWYIPGYVDGNIMWRNTRAGSGL